MDVGASASGVFNDIKRRGGNGTLVGLLRYQEEIETLVESDCIVTDQTARRIGGSSLTRRKESRINSLAHDDVGDRRCVGSLHTQNMTGFGACLLQVKSKFYIR